MEWVRNSSQILALIESVLPEIRPFDGLCIGTGNHLEPRTVALLMVLKAGGARIVASGNSNSTRHASVDYLRDGGIVSFTPRRRPAGFNTSNYLATSPKNARIFF